MGKAELLVELVLKSEVGGLVVDELVITGELVVSKLLVEDSLTVLVLETTI